MNRDNISTNTLREPVIVHVADDGPIQQSEDALPVTTSSSRAVFANCEAR